MNKLGQTMSMIGRMIQSYWVLHALAATIFLLSTVPMLWPQLAPAGTLPTMGWIFLGSFAVSFALAAIFIIYELLHLRNQIALLRVLSFLGVWVTTLTLSVLLTYRAKVPMDKQLVQEAPQLDITRYEANEKLHGESSLVVQIKLSESTSENIQESPQLVALERDHPEIFQYYLQQSPRWSEHSSDSFYAQLGHVEIILKDKDNNSRGVVHAAFRAITEGEEMPQGYTVIKPGEKLTPLAEEKERRGIPDIALDLGGNYFLLLAWRGIDDAALALRGVNDSIRYIDSHFDTLVKNPTREQVDHMVTGTKQYKLKQPDLRLSEPPSQYGTYQAEIYANPKEAGQLLLLIKESKNHNVLRVISCYARYSDNDDEYFLHEIPSDLPNWFGRQEWAPGRLMLDQGIPLFTIKRGDSDITFDADFEVWFAPSDSTKEKQLILSKRYRVHPCDYIADTKLRADEESDIKIITTKNLPETPTTTGEDSPEPKTKTEESTTTTTLEP